MKLQHVRARIAALASGPQRSALLPAAGIALGLLIAGVGLFGRMPRPASAVSVARFAI